MIYSISGAAEPLRKGPRDRGLRRGFAYRAGGLTDFRGLINVLIGYLQ